ncbi:MAG: hypothetical protein IK016_10890 [Lachnospiraceae bacterium]|nr:hypothetical protein [Lachnospiraceae bacterium]
MKSRKRQKKKTACGRAAGRTLLLLLCAFVLFVSRVAALRVRAEEEPKPPSWPEGILSGDFSGLTGTDAETAAVLGKTYERLYRDSRFELRDLNHDAVEELLWLYGGAEEDPLYLLAVFAEDAGDARLVMHMPEDGGAGFIDPSGDRAAFYIAHGEQILYLQHNSWTVSEVHCAEVLFDRQLDLYAGEALMMYLVEDAEAYGSSVDAAVRRGLSFVDGRGVWYFRLPTGRATDEGIRIGADAFMTAFRERCGTSFAQLLPAYETMRTGIERGVARQQFQYRSGRAEEQLSFSVTWPQIAEGASSFSPVINTLLKQEAFALTNAYDPAADEAAAPEQAVQKRLSAGEGENEEVRYRILHDDDTMISVLFRHRAGDAQTLKLLTVSKLNGRQIQIGDLTTTERLTKALGKETAEVFVPDEDLKRRRDETKRREEIQSVFEATTASSGDWKSIGLDEQYLYLVLREEGAEPFLLRVPRWEAGVDSPGHMHLLSMHRAYPFLKDVLDDAECLTVRRRMGGFDIEYRTTDGGSVSARLSDAQDMPKAYDSPDRARDAYMAKYADVTGFVTGSFAWENPAAGETVEASFDTVETAYGEGGRAFLSVDGKGYELTQRCSATRGGFLLREEDGSLRVSAVLRMEEDGNGDWVNTEQKGMTVFRNVSEETRLRLVLSEPSEALVRMEVFSEREEEERRILQTEFEEAELPVLHFPDLNADGTDDLELRFAELSYLYMYDPEEDALRALPELRERYAAGETEGFVSVRYDPGAGAMIVTLYDGDRKEQERLLHLTEQPEVAVREYRSEEKDGERRFVVTDPTQDPAETIAVFRAPSASPEAERMRHLAEDLFRAVYVFDEGLPMPAPAGEEGEGRTLRVILGQLYQPDLFSPGYKNRLYVLEEGGELLYTYDIPAEEKVTGVTKGYANGEESLLMQTEGGEPFTLPLSGLYESLPNP